MIRGLKGIKALSKQMKRFLLRRRMDRSGCLTKPITARQPGWQAKYLPLSYAYLLLCRGRFLTPAEHADQTNTC